MILIIYNFLYINTSPYKEFIECDFHPLLVWQTYKYLKLWKCLLEPFVPPSTLLVLLSGVFLFTKWTIFFSRASLPWQNGLTLPHLSHRLLNALHCAYVPLRVRIPDTTRAEHRGAIAFLDQTVYFQQWSLRSH